MYLIAISRRNKDLIADLNMSWRLKKKKKKKKKRKAFPGTAKTKIQGQGLTKCAPGCSDNTILPGEKSSW